MGKQKRERLSSFFLDYRAYRLMNSLILLKYPKYISYKLNIIDYLICFI